MSESQETRRQLYVGRMLQTYRRNARLRSVDWQLSREEFTSIVTKECHYCGEPPQTRMFRAWNHGAKVSVRFESKERVNGIDRVDNTQGYTLANAVPCCKRCNQLKSDMQLKEFLSQIERILSHTRAGA